MYVCMFIVLCRDHMYNLSLLSLPQMLPHSRHSPRGTIPHTTHSLAIPLVHPLPLPIPFHKHHISLLHSPSLSSSSFLYYSW